MIPAINVMDQQESILNTALFLSVGLLRPHVSGMTLCWLFYPHYGELLYVFMFL